MKSTKVLLLSPDLLRPVYNQNGRLKSERFCPPLGMGYLTAVLKNSGCEVRTIDCTGVSQSHVRGVLTEFQPDVVGVSCFTEQRGGALELARLAKAVDAKIRVVLGGSHVTFLYEQVLRNYPEVDFCVLGEGEHTIVELVEHIVSGGSEFGGLKGIAFRSGSEIVKTAPRALANLDELPFPDRDWIDVAAYADALPDGGRLGVATLMPARGCPYACQFCSTSQFWGKRTRLRGVPSIAAEMDLLWKQGVRILHVLADTFTLDQVAVRVLCEEMIQRKYQFSWSCATRAGMVTEDTAQLMKKAGCDRAVLGIESLSPRILMNIGKKNTVPQATETFRILRNAGIKTSCLLMVGNPGESRASIRETIENLRSLKADQIHSNLTQVYPGTPLYDLAREQGFMDDNYWLDENKAAPIYLQEHTLENLRRFQHDIQDAFFLQNQNYLRWFLGRSGLEKIVLPMAGTVTGVAKGLRAAVLRQSAR
jgi:magnesium-protoporphyrin IX monomethyl ester (oxidative) cyclase